MPGSAPRDLPPGFAWWVSAMGKVCRTTASPQAQLQLDDRQARAGELQVSVCVQGTQAARAGLRGLDHRVHLDPCFRVAGSSACCSLPLFRHFQIQRNS